MTGILDPDLLENARVELEKSYERLTPGDPTSIEVAEAIMTAFQRIEAGTYGSCALCFGEIDAERLRLFPYADKCVPCKAISEGDPAPKVFTDAPGVAVTADDFVELDCGHRAIVLGTGATSAFCPKCGRFENVTIPTPAKQGRVENGLDASAEIPPSVPARKEGDGEASVSPDPVDDNKTGERTYADLAIPKLHGGASVLQSIPVDKIKPSPDNPRDDVGDVAELAATIQTHGLLNPIGVYQNGDGFFYLETGHRRLAAVKSLEWDEIEAKVEKSSTRNEQEREEARLIENIQRSDLTPLEEAKAFRRLVDQHGLSQKELSERIGRSPSHISKRLALLELPTPAVELVVKGPVSGGISLEEAQLLGKVKDAKAVDKIVKDFKPGNRWSSIEFLVDEQVKRERAAEKKKKAIEKLKKDGVKLISFDGLYKIDFKKRATVGGQYGELGVDLKDHKTEPCHRARVEDGGRVTHYCIDQQRHTKKGASKLKATVKGTNQGTLSTADAERRQRQAENRKLHGELQKASKKRMDFLRPTLGKKKAKPDEVFSLFVLAIAATRVAGIYDLDSNGVCDFLGIKPKKLKGDALGDPEARVLRALVENDPADAAHVVTAAAIGSIEDALSPAMRDLEDIAYPAYKPYFEWLEKQGYELSEFEADQLAPRPKDEETSAA